MKILLKFSGKKHGQSNYSYVVAKDYEGIPTVFRTEFFDFGGGVKSTKSQIKTAFLYVIDGFVYYPKTISTGIVPGTKGMTVDDFKQFVVGNKD